ncbi:lysophospholipid acyltransferase family protein [Pseudaestuariivita sp.]|uniref:lysophospholipid acyltransferase family protein n=1 Tax=Pseudaestuariivita sp. TaxID=2211669 RepID=UPI004059C94A
MAKPSRDHSTNGTRTQWMQNLVLRGIIRCLLALPYTWRVPLMGWAARTLVAPIAGWRSRIRENLAYVRPDLSEEEVTGLTRAVPDNVGRTLIEIYSGADFVKRAVAAPIAGSGLAALEEARAEGRPVILVTAHFGNYDVARANLIARGHNMGALYRRMSNPWFNDHYVAAISQIGEPMFEQGRKGMTQLVRHIKGGGVLGILTDLNAFGAPKLNFFGKPAFTSVITAELALKYDAALIPIYSVRQSDGMSFEVRVEAPIPHTDAETMTQAVNDNLEALVREHMHQWFWIHKRWKPGRKERVAAAGGS